MVEDPDGHNASNSDNNSEPSDGRALGQQTLAALGVFARFLFATSMGCNGTILWAMGLFSA